VTARLSLLLFLASPAVPQDRGLPGKDSGFDLFDLGFPSGATRVMFYVMVGVIMVFGAAIVGLIFQRARADDDSGFARSGRR
jgi:hypothetical protein